MFEFGAFPSKTMVLVSTNLAFRCIENIKQTHLHMLNTRMAIFIKCDSFYFSIIPESYRWLVSVNRIDDAHDVIKKIGKMNRRPVPKKEELYKVVKSANRIEKGRKRTFLDVFRNRYLFRTTVLLGICWQVIYLILLVKSTCSLIKT